jgi:hypothetical protein
VDYREAILERLVEVIGGIPGIFPKLVGRSKITPSETQLPAVIVLDGTEEADDLDPRIRGPQAPRRVIMRPVIKIMLGDLPKSVGTELNGFRKAIINAIANDAILTGYTINGRGGRYMGIPENGLNLGRELEGTVWLVFEFYYPVIPGSI